MIDERTLFAFRAHWERRALGLFLQAQEEERRDVEARGRGGFNVTRWQTAFYTVWKGIADDWGPQVELQIAAAKGLSDSPSALASIIQFITPKADAVVEVSEEEWLAIGEGLWNPARAVQMAGTETVQATGFIQHFVAQQSPLQLWKVWVAIVDERTRPTHLDAYGQRQLLNDPFEVGSAQLQWPGDAGGPIGETINCRCWEDYELAAGP